MLEILALLFCSLVVIEHLFIASIELLIERSNLCSKIFKLDLETSKNPNIQTLFKNLGIYNLCVALGLAYGIFTHSFEIKALFLIFVIIVGIYGSLTSSRAIFFKQALPAILTLTFLCIA